MPGLYLHIPFCERKCIYCDFYSIERTVQMDEFVDALCQEIRMIGASRPESHRTLETLFWGGGTPSLLSIQQTETIVTTLREYFQFDSLAEWTIECNPGTVDAHKLRAYKQLGVNRLSFGIQSFHPNELDFLGRIHTPEVAREAVHIAQNEGFENINIDIMFALPNQTIDSYISTLEQAVALNTAHISAYSLIYEEGTPLFAQRLNGSVTPIDETVDSDMYNETIQFLQSSGYEQYEISNFCKPHLECQHNLRYWQAKEYYALGPSAHSYIGNQRRWNYRNLSRYINEVVSGHLPIANSEQLSTTDLLFESAFLGLRSNGIELEFYKNEYDIDIEFLIESNYPWWKEEQLLTSTIRSKDGQKILRLTEKGYPLCDEITVKLIALLEKETKQLWVQKDFKEDPDNETDIHLPVLQH